jgi:hypothetical protein
MTATPKSVTEPQDREPEKARAKRRAIKVTGRPETWLTSWFYRATRKTHSSSPVSASDLEILRGLLGSEDAAGAVLEVMDGDLTNFFDRDWLALQAVRPGIGRAVAIKLEFLREFIGRVST